MARKKGKTKTEQAVTDYRHEEARRLHIPPAGLAAQGKIREKPKIQYAYNPHLPPILRFDRTGKTDGLPELLEIAAPGPSVSMKPRCLQKLSRFMSRGWSGLASRRKKPLRLIPWPSTSMSGFSTARSMH